MPRNRYGRSWQPGAALEAAAANVDQVVKLTVYLTDPADLEVALWARDELLGRARPLACSLVTGADPVHPAFRVKVDH